MLVQSIKNVTIVIVGKYLRVLPISVVLTLPWGVQGMFKKQPEALF